MCLEFSLQTVKLDKQELIFIALYFFYDHRGSQKGSQKDF